MGSIIANTAGGIISANMQMQQGESQRKLADQNSVLSGMQAQDALARGNTNAGIAEMKGGALAGQQKADYAASGVDASSGSAATTQLTTQAMADLDASIIKNNAARQAWGYKVQQLQEEEQGALDYKTAQNNASATLLTMGAKNVGSAANFGLGMR